VKDEAEGLLAGRALALYALSLAAAGSATLAWWPAEGGLFARLAVLAAALAAASVLGDGLSARLLGVLERRTLARLRLVAGAVHASAAFVGIVAALGSADPRVLAVVTSVCTFVQIGVVALADVLGGPALALLNALVLTVAAALAGGPVAAVAVTAFLGLFVVFTAFDHFQGRLSAYPATRGDPWRTALGQAAAIAAPLVVAMAVYFAAFPPSPYARIPGELRRHAAVPGRLEEALARIVFLAVLGGGAVFGLRRALGPGAQREPPSEDVVDPERGAEEPIDGGSRRRAPADASRRGRIVRAYVGFLSTIERRGFLRRPSQTPAAIAAHLRAPAIPLRRLTELFVAARYGPDEPVEGDVRAAEAAAREVIDSQRSFGSRKPTNTVDSSG
jgi:hypothetical protein